MLCITEGDMPRKKCRTLLLRLLVLVTVFTLATNFIDFLYGTDSAIIKLYNPDSKLEDEASWFFVGDEQQLGLDVVSYDIKDCDCDVPHMENAVNRKGSWDVTEMAHLCKRVKPQCGSCKFADEIFHSFSPSSCHSETQIEICRLQVVKTQEVPDVHCNASVCASNVTLSALNPDTGEMDSQVVNSSGELAKIISEMISPNNERKHFGFVFLKCSLESEPIIQEMYHNYEYAAHYMYEFKQTGTQMVLLPPQIKLKRNMQEDLKPKIRSKNVNINFIFIDSVSRHHFYRSLPKTIKFFEKLNSDKEKKTLALDFQIMQSIKSRTFESLQALFSGYVNPEETPFGIQDMPPTPLNVEGLFKPYKNSGYHTLWLEDLCWLWEWGLPKDLLFHNKNSTVSETWKMMNAALHNRSIDNLDITFSSCQFLDEYGVKDPFYGPDAVCLNGHHQHEYFLKYLTLYQKKLLENREPFFTFYESNVNHENTGVRIQTFDAHLVKYLQFAASQPNTLTIIVSDHGNAYGTFMERNLEGRFELYHPAFFMIIPYAVANYLGDKRLYSLIINQHRLVSLLDLHYTLLSLITESSEIHIPKHYRKYNMSQKGLFEEISPNRTCHQIPRVAPTLCLCENFEEPVANNTLYAHYALFAIGELNNMLSKQYRESLKQSSSGFGRCQRLIPTNFTNIRQSHNTDGSIVIKMDVLVPQDFSDKFSPMEIFFVSLKYYRDHSKGLMLEMYTRLTPYSPFKGCVDEGVDLSLCICDTKKDRNNFQEIPLGIRANFLKKHIMLTTTQMRPVNGKNTALSDNCFFIFIRNNDAGSTFEAVNFCVSKSYLLTLELSTEGMIVSHEQSVVKVKLSFGDVKYLMSAVIIPTVKIWHWSYKASLMEV